jgi:hypothetical protein
MDHRLESQIDFASADDLGDILHRQVSNLPIPAQEPNQEHTLGSFGSKIATLTPSSLKNPLA